MATQVPTATLEAAVFDEAVASVPARTRRVHPLAAYILRRIGLYLLTLWGSLSASFFFFRLIPGDPLTALVRQFESRGQLGAATNSEEISRYYRHELGMDGSLLSQYGRYFYRLVFQLDLGPSLLSYPNPASDLIARALPWTLGLLTVATLLGWLVGVLAGTFVAWRRRSRLANVVTAAALLFSHIPSYFIALFLVYLLAYQHSILPPNGAYNAAIDVGWSWAFVASVIKYGTLPVIATSLVAASNWLISTRSLVIQILGEDYLTYAGAKGLSSWRILNRYVMRNAWIPQIAALGITLGGVVNGNVLVERLFRYPGLGNLLIEAIAIKDVNTAQAIINMLIILVLTVNLVVDLALPLLDPRIKLGG